MAGSSARRHKEEEGIKQRLLDEALVSSRPTPTVPSAGLISKRLSTHTPREEACRGPAKMQPFSCMIIAGIEFEDTQYQGA